jgi:ParB family chromosome partitioning protein
VARLKDIAERSTDLFWIDPALIQVKIGWNSRIETPEYMEKLHELKRSIAEVGVKTPLTINLEMGSAVTLEDGHRRLAAVMLARAEGAEIKLVPCIPGGRFDTEADRLLSQVIRNDGVPLAPIELASVFKRLIGYGWSIPDIAKKTGRSQASVSQILSINHLAEPVKAMIADGEVSASLAIEITRQEGEGATEVLETARAEVRAEATAKGKDPGVARVTAAAVAKSPEKLMAELQRAFDRLPDDLVSNFIFWMRQTGRAS